METNVTALTRPVLTAIRADIDAALAQISAKHGVKVSPGRCTFGDLTATMKLDIAVITPGSSDSDSVERITARSDWTRYAAILGVDPALLDTTIDHNGKTYKIIGLLPRRKAPILVADTATQKAYMLPASVVGATIPALR